MAELKVTHLPPVLSDDDFKYECECIEALVRIEQQFKAAVEPWQKKLADIYARYPIRIIITEDKEDSETAKSKLSTK